MMLKLKFTHNLAMLDIVNNSSEIVILSLCAIWFNNLINTLKKEEKLETGEKYPW